MVLLIAAMLFVFNTSAQVLPDGTLTVTGVTAGGLKTAIESALAGYTGATKADITKLIITGALGESDFNNELNSKTGDDFNYSGLEALDLTNVSSWERNQLFWINSPTLVDLILPANLGVMNGICGESFQDMRKLARIQISDSNTNYKTVDGVLFTKDGKTLIKYPIAKPDLYYTTPAGVETLGHSSLVNTTYLEAIVVSEGVKFCEEWIFTGSSALKSITFPTTLTTVKNGLMRNVLSLKQVILLCTTPPTSIQNDGAPLGTHELMWDSWYHSYGVLDATTMDAYTTGNWKDAIRDLPIYIYRPVTVNNAMSPYPYAVQGVQVPIIAETTNGELSFSKWESDSEIIFGDPENPVTYFTVPADNDPIVITAVYRAAYHITMINGTASMTDATEGQQINIEPSEVTGKQFSHWTADGEDIVFDNPNRKDTYFTMVGRDVTITAVFNEPYTVTVIGGVTLNPEAVEGQVVTIMANPSGTFENWTSEDDGIVFDDPNKRNTSFVMPAKNVTVQANFVTGIENIDADQVVIYPNPANDVIYIKGLDENDGYKIVDITGKVLLRGSAYNGEAIDVTSLSSGVYFFQSNGTTIKFIKK